MKIEGKTLFCKFMSIMFLCILSLLLLILIPNLILAQETPRDVDGEESIEDKNTDINIVSVNDVKKLMSDTFESIQDYTADFTWINGDARYRGEIKYKKPDRIILNFEDPKDQKIVSDGKVLYIYIPYLKVVIKQSLGEGTESEILTTTSEKGLYKLFNEYAFSFYDKSSLQKFGNTYAYHLRLTQKRAKVGFKKMDMWVSKNGLILQTNGVSPSGVKVSLSFSNIRLNSEVPDYIFDFEIPPDAQVIRNILVPFSEK